MTDPASYEAFILRYIQQCCDINQLVGHLRLRLRPIPLAASRHALSNSISVIITSCICEATYNFGGK